MTSPPIPAATTTAPDPAADRTVAALLAGLPASIRRRWAWRLADLAAVADDAAHELGQEETYVAQAEREALRMLIAHCAVVRDETMRLCKPLLGRDPEDT